MAWRTTANGAGPNPRHPPAPPIPGRRARAPLCTSAARALSKTVPGVTISAWVDFLAISAFVLSISPTNEPSLALARALGFTACGSRMDEEDGVELLFTRRLEAWPGEWGVAWAP